VKRPVTVVTGGAGFAGRHLLDALARYDDVHAWYRPGGTPPPTGSPVTWHAVELRDRAAVTATMAAIGPARVFHLAGAPSVEASWQNAVPHLEINALCTAHVLGAIQATARPCRVLVVTSAQVYGSSDTPIGENDRLVPQSPYGLTKLAQDMLAAAAAGSDGMDVMVARPFNHVGPGQAANFAVSSFARQIARIEHGIEPSVLRVGNLEARRDVTDVRDVAAAYVRIVDDGRPGRAYNVCSERAWRVGDLLEELVRQSTASIRIEVDHARLRPSDVPLILGDATRIRTELGWVPQIRVEDTLRDTLEWWRTMVASGDKSPGQIR
jgi:GDP-4-dehydro-6-deoxy-D-mannose reductase